MKPGDKVTSKFIEVSGAQGFLMGIIGTHAKVMVIFSSGRAQEFAFKVGELRKVN